MTMFYTKISSTSWRCYLFGWQLFFSEIFSHEHVIHSRVFSFALLWYDNREVIFVELNLEGVIVGVASLLVIGAFHPLVIWCEYRFTQRIWPVFLITGLLCMLAALLLQGLFSILLGLLGASCLWSIRELKEQPNGWNGDGFPKIQRENRKFSRERSNAT